MNVTMTTMVVVRIIQVHENACLSNFSLSLTHSLSLFLSSSLSLFLSLSLSTFWNLMWTMMFLNGYKGNEDPLGEDRGGGSLENDVHTFGVCEGIYTVIA